MGMEHGKLLFDPTNETGVSPGGRSRREPGGLVNDEEILVVEDYVWHGHWHWHWHGH
jgi:hypothetical protein